MNCYLLLCSCSCWAYVVSAAAVPISTTPPTGVQLNEESPMEGTPGQGAQQMGRGFQGTGRIFPDMFGSMFDSIPFLPLNINVPDVFSGMYSLVNQYFASDSSPRPTSGRRNNRRRTTVTTTTTSPPDLDPEDPESLSREHSDGMSNEDFEEMYEEYIRKKDEFDKLKKKKKKRKHKHDDMLHKIASHLAYLELEC